MRKATELIISFTCILIIICMLFAGCGVTEKIMTYREGDPVYKDETRFVYVNDGKLGGMDIIRDRETGVLYILYEYGYSAGICPLYDSEGNIVVDKEK